MNDFMLRAENLTRRFGDHAAVASVSLDLAPGEMVTLLGPSGCGKTTTLRILAGLERVDTGEILGRNRRVLVSSGRNIFVPPHQRNIGMVFQSYAIWPHMTVFENVAYPLKLRRMARDDIRKRVESTLELVGLAGFGERPAPMLSGGQQQRVALARALAGEPDLLLLDEPFSNLDTELRTRMRHEMRSLKRKLGLSSILVTHDQIEALSLSDRIIVMRDGAVEQVGKPMDLYTRPATPFVRDFLGKTIILEGVVTEVRADGCVGFSIVGYPGTALQARSTRTETLHPGKAAHLAIRPEDVVTCVIASDSRPDDADANTVRGVIESLLFIGSRNEARIELDGGQYLPLFLPRGGEWSEGRRVELRFPRDETEVWPA